MHTAWRAIPPPTCSWKPCHVRDRSEQHHPWFQTHWQTFSWHRRCNPFSLWNAWTPSVYTLPRKTDLWFHKEKPDMLLKKLTCLEHNLGIKHKQRLSVVSQRLNNLWKTWEELGTEEVFLRRNTTHGLDDKRLPKWYGYHAENMGSLLDLGWKRPYIPLSSSQLPWAGTPSIIQVA